MIGGINILKINIIISKEIRLARVEILAFELHLLITSDIYKVLKIDWGIFGLRDRECILEANGIDDHIYVQLVLGCYIKDVQKILDVSRVRPLARLVPDDVEFASLWYAYFLVGDQQPQQQPQGYDYSQYENRLVDIERAQAEQRAWHTQHDPIISGIQPWRLSVDSRLSAHSRWIASQGQRQDNLSFFDLLNSEPIPAGAFPYDGVPIPMQNFDNTPTQQAGPSFSSYMPGTSVSQPMAGRSRLHDVVGTSAGTSHGPSMQHAPDMFHTPAQMPPPPEGRPHRELHLGPQLVSPFTVLPTTTPEPQRDNVDSGRRPPSQVLRMYRMGELPARCKIVMLPKKDIKPDWWATLLGEGPSTMFSSSHVEAWTRMVQAGHENNRLTIMTSSFISDLCNGKLGDNHVKMADGRLSGSAWPAWKDVDVVIMPHCFEKKHWVVFVCSFPDRRVTVYDPDVCDKYRRVINLMLAKFNKRITQFVCQLGIIPQGDKLS